MIREETSDCSEPRRPPRTPTPWVPIVLTILAGLAVAHLAGLTTPLTTKALQIGRSVAGSSRTPGSRLIGEWESDNDPMFRRVCHPAPKKNYNGTGIYLADAGRGMHEVIFRIVSEDDSGRHLELAEFVLGANANYRVRYTIAPDGRSMTREYSERNGRQVSCQYRYLGPPTQDVAIEHRPD
jgi:hypothetical protein